MNNNQISTYYIPINPNIQKGSIYTLYINNNTNLDLSSIITSKTLVSNKLIIDDKEYNQLLKINTLIKELIVKRKNRFELFLTEEKQITNELDKLTNEYQIILNKTLTKERENG